MPGFASRAQRAKFIQFVNEKKMSRHDFDIMDSETEYQGLPERLHEKRVEKRVEKSETLG